MEKKYLSNPDELYDYALVKLNGPIVCIMEYLTDGGFKVKVRTVHRSQGRFFCKVDGKEMEIPPDTQVHEIYGEDDAE